MNDLGICLHCGIAHGILGHCWKLDIKGKKK